MLEAARVVGEQRIAAAEKSAQQLVANAKAEATKIRAEADAVLHERRAEAELAATDIVADGRAEAQSITTQARVDADAMLAGAADRVERARNECDALVHEAEEARAQILEDMERRRRQARAQVERLRVGRDRLLRSYDVVRRTLEETTGELKSSLNEAKVRGDGAARAIIAEPAATREQLEAELRDAKMIGRIAIPQATDPTDPSDPTDRETDGSKATDATLRSPALPRRLDPPPTQSADAADSSNASALRPRGAEATKRSGVPRQPKAPAMAPTLTASPNADESSTTVDPIAAMIEAAEARRVGTAAPVSASLDSSQSAADAQSDADDGHGPVDDELAQLEDEDLAVIEPSDEIEEVVAIPAVGAGDGATSPGLFAELRAQRSGDDPTPDNEALSPATAPKVTASPATAPKVTAGKATASTSTRLKATAGKAKGSRSEPGDEPAGAEGADPVQGIDIEAQRDAVIADATRQLEKRLKRALADEQNDLLAGIRAANKKPVELTAIVGDVDSHVNRYVHAIHEVAAVAYGAGAALVDARPREGQLPAGAVEELLAFEVVLPIRERLESLDCLEVETADLHLDPLRAFYRQRKTDHLEVAASRLARLLCVAGVCDALPNDSSLPWTPPTKQTI